MRTDVLGTLVLLRVAEFSAPASCRCPPTRSTATSRRGRRRERTTRPAFEPVQRVEGGRRPPGARCVRTFGVNASITRGSNTYGPNQYPEKILPLFVTNALDGAPLPPRPWASFRTIDGEAAPPGQRHDVGRSRRGDHLRGTTAPFDCCFLFDGSFRFTPAPSVRSIPGVALGCRLRRSRRRRRRSRRAAVRRPANRAR